MDAWEVVVAVTGVILLAVEGPRWLRGELRRREIVRTLDTLDRVAVRDLRRGMQLVEGAVRALQPLQVPLRDEPAVAFRVIVRKHYGRGLNDVIVDRWGAVPFELYDGSGTVKVAPERPILAVTPVLNLGPRRFTEASLISLGVPKEAWDHELSCTIWRVADGQGVLVLGRAKPLVVAASRPSAATYAIAGLRQDYVLVADQPRADLVAALRRRKIRLM